MHIEEIHKSFILLFALSYIQFIEQYPALSYWQKKMYSLKSLWIKASAKCINVNVKVWAGPVNSCHCLKQGGWDLHFLSNTIPESPQTVSGPYLSLICLVFFTKVSPRPVGDTQLSHAVTTYCPFSPTHPSIWSETRPTAKATDARSPPKFICRLVLLQLESL